MKDDTISNAQPDQDPAWLAAFMEAREDLLAYLKRKAGPGHQPVDLLQDVFLRMWKSSASEPVDNHRAYLFRVAANVAIDAARSERARVSELPDSENALMSTGDPKPDALQTAIDRQRLHCLDEALAELPEETRAMVHLIRIDGLGFAEVARMFGVSKSTVEKRVAKAVKHCRDTLSRLDDADDQ